jgi:2,3-dihydroxybenzoate decarboxylase
MADPTAATVELERAVKHLGFKGAMLNGHVHGEFLDHRKYWPLFERAQSLEVPIYLHPTRPPKSVLDAYFDGYPELLGASWGFAIDTSIHFLRLLFAGVFDAFPRLTIVLGHLGEGLPFGMHRLNEYAYLGAKRRGLKKAPAQYLRENLLVTTSGNFFAPAFLCTYLALGAENIMFSVDWPYESNVTAVKFFDDLPISMQDKHKIAHLNAERLFRI